MYKFVRILPYMSNCFLVSITVKAGICFLLGGNIHPSPSGDGEEGASTGILGQHQAMGVVPGSGMHQPGLH